jgi:hypothetical protein
MLVSLIFLERYRKHNLVVILKKGDHRSGECRGRSVRALESYIQTHHLLSWSSSLIHLHYARNCSMLHSSIWTSQWSYEMGVILISVSKCGDLDPEWRRYLQQTTETGSETLSNMYITQFPSHWLSSGSKRYVNLKRQKNRKTQILWMLGHRQKQKYHREESHIKD